MIVCSCNVLTDHDVRSTLADRKEKPRTTGQVYGCLGCSAQCGRCARTIRRIMDEALLGAGAAVAIEDAPACSAPCKCCPAKHAHS
jgi:bacterioferritin-associated ferredoxin